MRPARFVIPAALLASAMPVTHVDAQTMRVIVGFAEGGASSTSCRALALVAGPQFVVENMPGAGGKLAADHVVRYQGGDKLFCMSSTSTLKVQPDSGLVPIGIFAEYDYVMVVKAGAPDTLEAYMAAANMLGGDALRDVATAGGGSVAHLIGEMLFRKHGLRMMHVAQKGSAPAMLDTKKGVVAAAIVPYSDFVGFRDELKIVARSGNGIDIGGWMGIFAPPGTSPDEAARLAALFEQATPHAKDRLEPFGFRALWRPASALTERHRDDYETLMPLVTELGVKP